MNKEQQTIKNELLKSIKKDSYNYLYKNAGIKANKEIYINFANDNKPKTLNNIKDNLKLNKCNYFFISVWEYSENNYLYYTFNIVNIGDTVAHAYCNNIINESRTKAIANENRKKAKYILYVYQVSEQEQDNAKREQRKENKNGDLIRYKTNKYNYCFSYNNSFNNWFNYKDKSQIDKNGYYTGDIKSNLLYRLQVLKREKNKQLINTLLNDEKTTQKYINMFSKINKQLIESFYKMQSYFLSNINEIQREYYINERLTTINELIKDNSDIMQKIINKKYDSLKDFNERIKNRLNRCKKTFYYISLYYRADDPTHEKYFNYYRIKLINNQPKHESEQ